MNEQEPRRTEAAAPAEAMPAPLPRWTTLKLVLGILMMLSFLVISLQSCAAGLYNVISDNGEAGGGFGLLSGLLRVCAGIVGVATRNSPKRGGAIAVTVLTWIVFFLSRVGAGSYGDLLVWGMFGFLIGCVFLSSVLQSKKAKLIGAAVAVVYLVIGLL